MLFQDFGSIPVRTLIAAFFGVCSLSAVAFAQSPENPAPAPLVPDYKSFEVIDSQLCDAKATAVKLYTNVTSDGHITEVAEFTIEENVIYLLVSKDYIFDFFTRATPETQIIHLSQIEFDVALTEKAPNAYNLITTAENNDCVGP